MKNLENYEVRLTNFTPLDSNLDEMDEELLGFSSVAYGCEVWPYKRHTISIYRPPCAIKSIFI